MLMNIRKRITNKKGFTLVELMVVIAVMGILAALVLPKLSGTNDAAKNGTMIGDLRTIDGAMTMFYATNKTYTGATVKALYDAKLLSTEVKDADGKDFKIADADDFGYNLTGTTVGAKKTIHSPGSKDYNPANDK